MLTKTTTFLAGLLLAVLVMICAGAEAIAQDSAWRVSKSSGDVWITTSGAQPAALTSDTILKPGDMVRTGPNGRVLLARGAETILISPNSVIGIRDGNGSSTTIVHQAGSILLDIEKRNVPHFEVLTPYLAAVVKGTQFRVTVGNDGSHVDVVRGQVEVTDYRTGQYALVDPGQAARVSAREGGGLSLSGSGSLSPIQQGMPRSSSVRPMTIPNEGLSAPDRMENQQQSLAPERHAQWVPSDAASKEYGSGVLGWAKGVLGLSDGAKRDEAMTLTIAVPAVIGFCAAVGAGVVRQRRKQKNKTGGR
jgi:FecR protein